MEEIKLSDKIYTRAVQIAENFLSEYPEIINYEVLRNRQNGSIIKIFVDNTQNDVILEEKLELELRDISDSLLDEDRWMTTKIRVDVVK